MPGEGTVNIMLEDNPKGGFHQAQQGAGRPNAGRAKWTTFEPGLDLTPDPRSRADVGLMS